MSASTKLHLFSWVNAYRCTVGQRSTIAEGCPSDIIRSTNTRTVEVAKPQVTFVTWQGHLLTHVCSHFEAGNTHNFTLGTHDVICTAFNEDSATGARAECRFRVNVTGSLWLLYFLRKRGPVLLSWNPLFSQPLLSPASPEERACSDEKLQLEPRDGE